jgi:hypothetical protein
MENILISHAKVWNVWYGILAMNIKVLEEFDENYWDFLVSNVFWMS